MNKDSPNRDPLFGSDEKKTFHTCFRLLADVFRLTRNPWPLNSKMLDFIYPRLAAPPSSHAAQVYSRQQQQTHSIQ